MSSRFTGMLKEFVAPKTLSEAIRYFADPDRANAFVVTLRWPNGVICPHCEADKPSFLKTRRIWKCRSCRKQFSIKVGTIFEDSPLGLDKWLPALWMLANCKNGISSYELARALGVTQKTAWFMLGRIRMAMGTKTFKRFGGTVEIDESFIGGLSKNMHASRRRRMIRGGGPADKTAVLGVLKRKGKKGKASQVQAMVIADLKMERLYQHISETVRGGSTLYTDKARYYGRRALAMKYRHAMIDHALEYVRGACHTNGMENFWSLLKRAIKGTYVAVDPFHVFRYVDEQVYRFNNRTETDGDRFKGVLRNILGKRLTYADLISANMPLATT